MAVALIAKNASGSDFETIRDAHTSFATSIISLRLSYEVKILPTAKAAKTEVEKLSPLPFSPSGHSKFIWYESEGKVDCTRISASGQSNRFMYNNGKLEAYKTPKDSQFATSLVESTKTYDQFIEQFASDPRVECLLSVSGAPNISVNDLLNGTVSVKKMSIKQVNGKSIYTWNGVDRLRTIEIDFDKSANNMVSRVAIIYPNSAGSDERKVTKFRRLDNGSYFPETIARVTVFGNTKTSIKQSIVFHDILINEQALTTKQGLATNAIITDVNSDKIYKVAEDGRRVTIGQIQYSPEKEELRKSKNVYFILYSLVAVVIFLLTLFMLYRKLSNRHN